MLILGKSHSRVSIGQSWDSIETWFGTSTYRLWCACSHCLTSGGRQQPSLDTLICCHVTNPGVPVEAGITLRGDLRCRVQISKPWGRKETRSASMHSPFALLYHLQISTRTLHVQWSMVYIYTHPVLSVLSTVSNNWELC